MKKIVDLQFNYDKANDYCISEGKLINGANEEYYVAVSRNDDFVNINIAKYKNEDVDSINIPLVTL